MPSGEVPVDQTACPLTVTLPPAAAGLGLRATSSVSVPAGGSEDVTGGPVVPGCRVVLGGKVVPGGRLGTYTSTGDLVIFTLSSKAKALRTRKSMVHVTILHASMQ